VLVSSDFLCLISVFLPQSQFMKPVNASSDDNSLFVVYLLIGGVIAARFGLHMFDLCIIQLFQEEITETNRGIFSGVEAFFCNSMDMIKYALVILLPSPQLHFGYLVTISFTSVFLGWCIFVIFITRKHTTKENSRQLAVHDQDGIDVEGEEEKNCKGQGLGEEESPGEVTGKRKKGEQSTTYKSQGKKVGKDKPSRISINTWDNHAYKEG